MAAAAPHHRPTCQAKEPFARSWYIADVEGQTLGRAATKIADVLRGKHRPTFTSHVDAGDFVVVVNADKVRLSGKKWTIKLYRDHSLFPGGLRTQTAAQLVKRHPEDLVTVRRVRERQRRRAVGPGGRDPPRHVARADKDRSGVPGRPEEGRLPDARRAPERAQEVRPARRPRPLPVQQALTSGPSPSL